MEQQDLNLVDPVPDLNVDRDDQPDQGPKSTMEEGKSPKAYALSRRCLEVIRSSDKALKRSHA